MAEIGTDILKAKSILEAGELVAIPTETVYGLAANALNEIAVTRIFDAKNRPFFDPLIIHVPDFESVDKYVANIPDAARQLAKNFWPGPLTLVLKKRSLVPDIVTSGLDTVGLRSPDHPLAQKILHSLAFPLAAPSANPFGYVSPTSAAHVNDQLGAKIKYIIDGGTCNIGIESTIVGFENNIPVVFRLGGLTIEEIEKVVGKVGIHAVNNSNPRSPGQLDNHYAPAKKIILGNIEQLIKQHPVGSTAVLSFQKQYDVTHQFTLSRDGSLHEAAKNLFSALREIDKMPVDLILAEYVPDYGIGRAINDRLKRASTQTINPI